MTSAAPATPAPTGQESVHLRSSGRSRFIGAMFLMATSAIGPGFLTQTTVFTDDLRAAFAFGRWVTDYERWAVVAFIAVSSGIFLVLGTTPVRLLIFAGAFNGLILPVGFGLRLWVAARRHDLMGGYRYPRWLVVVGVVAWVASVYLGYELLTTLEDL
jgi:Mn2+/Fe2+ NRAMP family transporter